MKKVKQTQPKSSELTQLIELVKHHDGKLANIIVAYNQYEDIPDITVANIVECLERNFPASLTGKFIQEKGWDTLQVDTYFEKIRQITHIKLRLMVACMMANQRHFKVPGEVLQDVSLMVEIMQLMNTSFENFPGYFEYKKYGQKTKTDYRAPVEVVTFLASEVDKAAAELISSRAYEQEKKGVERVVVAKFPNLAPEDLSKIKLDDQMNGLANHVIRSLPLPDKKLIILIVRPILVNIIDLHGLGLENGKAKAIEHLQGMYSDFQNKATLITGKGNHSAGNVSKMNDSIGAYLKQLIEDGPKVIKSFSSAEGKITIKFKEPVTATAKTLAKAIENKEHRISYYLPNAAGPDVLRREQSQLVDTIFKLNAQNPAGQQKLTVFYLPLPGKALTEIQLLVNYGDAALFPEQNLSVWTERGYCAISNVLSPTATSAPVCRFFAKEPSACRNGDACKFRHTPK